MCRCRSGGPKHLGRVSLLLQVLDAVAQHRAYLFGTEALETGETVQNPHKFLNEKKKIPFGQSCKAIKLKK